MDVKERTEMSKKDDLLGLELPTNVNQCSIIIAILFLGSSTVSVIEGFTSLPGSMSPDNVNTP